MELAERVETGIEIQVDSKALNDVGIDPTTPITKNLKGIYPLPDGGFSVENAELSE